MKILITGGAGYVGTEVIHALSNIPEVESIILYDNLSTKNFNLFLHRKIAHKNIQLVRGDMLDSRKLKEVVAASDVILHLAAVVTTPFSNESPHRFEQVNNWGTAELCYAVEEAQIDKLIYLSSMSVYGSRETVINENSAPDPKTFYGISKLRGEEHIARLLNKTNTTIIRCGNVYGFSPAMRFDAVINRFMFEANFLNRITIQGSGKQKRAFIHVNSVVNVLVAAILGQFPGGIYNLADKNLSVLELVAAIKDIYPSLEFLFVNQHMQLRNITLDLELNLKKYLDLQPTDLHNDLLDFSNQFAFRPRVS